MMASESLRYTRSISSLYSKLRHVYIHDFCYYVSVPSILLKDRTFLPEKVVYRLNENVDTSDIMM